MSARMDPDHFGRRIDCPMAWCSGDWRQHGGEGQHPEDWVHDDARGIELPHGATLTRDQEGTRPVLWQLSMSWEGSTVIVRHDVDPAGISRALREIAGAIDAVPERAD